jgi:hypothetical protein
MTMSHFFCGAGGRKNRAPIALVAQNRAEQPSSSTIVNVLQALPCLLAVFNCGISLIRGGALRVSLQTMDTRGRFFHLKL